MSLQNQPKSIDDYKDVVKILKLKIIKQNKRIQELQLKNKTFQDQINSVTLRGSDLHISSRAMLELQNDANSKKQQRQIEMNTLKGKVQVMNIYAKGLKKIGISPQSVFRIADFAYKNYVESDYFREVLAKIKLGLTQKQISCLIFIFDQAYSGFITRDDYYNSLHAYKIAMEDNSYQYIHECIFKLSQMLHTDKVNLIKFFEEMEGRSKSKVGSTNKKLIDLNIFQEQIKKLYGARVSQREIIASFNSIDLESQGYLQKSNFLYTVTSFINKLLTGDDGLSKKSQNQWSHAKSHLTQPFQGASPKRNDKIPDSFNQTSKLPPLPHDAQPNSQLNCVARLQKEYGVPLSKVYQQILLFNFSSRLTLKTFKKLCSKVNQKLNPQILGQLYKQIDDQFKGSVYFNELFNFYLTYSYDTQIILRLFGKYFELSDLDSQKFWFMFGLNAQSEISKGKFLEIMKKNFQSKDEKIWENVWGLFDKGRGSCSVGTIIKYLQKYQC